MLKLIYEKPSFFKVEIIRLLVENGGKKTKNSLIDDLGLSNATINKYLKEIEEELPKATLIFSDNIVVFDIKRCSLRDVQQYYFSQSVVKDILNYCFFYPKISFERLASELYISHSKLFNILKFMDKQLGIIGISIQRRPYIKLTGSFESILVLYNLFLQTEALPFDKSFSKLNLDSVKKRVINLLESYNLQLEYFIVEELCLWILTVNDRFYLSKVCDMEKELDYDKFINVKSPILSRIKSEFSLINPKTFDTNGCLLIVIFIIFNMTSFHFKNTEEEKEFFSKEIIEDYQYESFILSVLMKQPYDVSSKFLEVLSVKMEGVIHFSSLIYPYYYLSRPMLTPKLSHSEYLNNIKIAIKEDFEEIFESIYKNNEWIYELLANVIISFQKRYIGASVINIGVYSIRGSIFEVQYSEEVKKAINIVPYYSLNGKTADLLLVDDIELLNNTDNYKRYMIMGDAKYDKDQNDWLLL